jgi:periplasmic divalent cation tolerance protein
MSARPPRAINSDHDPLTAAHINSRIEQATGSPSTVVNGLPQLRTRPVIIDHSLTAQWKGTAGRAVQANAYVGEQQRYGIFVILFLIAALLIVCTLHFSEPHERLAHPAAVLAPDHPHMLKRAAAMAQAQASAALAPGGAALFANPLSSAYSVLYVTVPSTGDVAQKLAAGLLEKRLIACANILPGVTSMYRWEGKVQTDSEQLMMLKTRASLFPAVRDFVRENHPYQTPEIIELPIQQAHQPYLDWIRDNTVGQCNSSSLPRAVSACCSDSFFLAVQAVERSAPVGWLVAISVLATARVAQKARTLT